MNRRWTWGSAWLMGSCIAVLLVWGCPTDPPYGDDDDDDASADDDSGDDDTSEADDDTTGDDDSAGDDDDTEPPPVELTIPCLDSIDDVYVTPEGLPPWDETVLGDVVRCAPEEVLSVAEVHDQLMEEDIDDVVPFSGAAVYRIAYRTTRWEGEEGIGSARIYLPDTQALAGTLPLVIVGHGTIGLADHCAPSLYPTISREMILPLVGSGFAVVAPDYAGLGTDGIQGYGDNHDTGHSMLDASRALRGIVTPGSVSDGAIAVGHSQGGGAALSAHALGASYGDGEILGAIPFAPGWATSTENLWWVSHYPYLAPWAGTPALVMTLALYADAANHLGTPYETSYFDPFIAEEVAEAVAEECLLGLSAHLPLLSATVGGALDEEFIDTVAACLDGSPFCGQPGEAYVQRAEANLMSVDPASGPILYVQGMLDVANSPAGAACLVDALLEDGATVQVCTDAGAEHMDVTARQAAFMVEWAVALARGEPLPACAENELPACE